MKNRIAEYRYVYDPSHQHKPAGNWNRTNSGWSSNSAESGTSTTVKKPAKSVNHPKPKKDVKKQENLFDEENNFDTELNQPQPVKSQQTSEFTKVEEEPVEKDEPIVVEQEQEVDLDEPVQEEQEVDLDEPVQEEQEVDLDEPVQEEETDQDVDFFTEQKQKQFLDEQQYDEFIEKMNAFIDVFDEDEGKENKVTFKAVASNLDWSIEDDVKAFSEHCKKQNIEGAEEIIAFLYYQYNNDKEKWETILEKMN